MTWVLEEAPDLPPELFAVLMGYANHASNDGTGAYPSHDTLSKYARKSVRQIRKDVARLVERGLLKVGDQRIASPIRADRRPVVYDLPLADTQAARDAVHDRNLTTGRVVPPGTTGSSRPVPQGHHDLSHSSYKPSTNPTTKPSSSSLALVPDDAPAIETPKTGGKQARGTRLPAKFEVTDEMKEWFRVHCPNVENPRRHHEAFCDHWAAAAGQRGVKADWIATWRNWMRKEQDAALNAANRPGQRPAPAAGPRRLHVQ